MGQVQIPKNNPNRNPKLIRVRGELGNEDGQVANGGRKNDGGGGSGTMVSRTG